MILHDPRLKALTNWYGKISLEFTPVGGYTVLDHNGRLLGSGRSICAALNRAMRAACRGA